MSGRAHVPPRCEQATDLAQRAADSSTIDELTHASDVNNLANALSDRCARNGEPAVPVAAIKWFGEALGNGSEAAGRSLRICVWASGSRWQRAQDGQVLWFFTPSRGSTLP